MDMHDVGGIRTLSIEGNNPFIPTSVFVSCGNGFCIEVDRMTFIETIRKEFDLVPVGFFVGAAA